MASGRVNGSVGKNSFYNGIRAYSFFVDWVSTPNYDGNYSLITASMRFGMGPAKLSFYNTVNTPTATITIDGQTRSITKKFYLSNWTEIENPWDPPAQQRSACTVFTCDPVQVNHNADGSRTFSLSAEVNLGSSTYSPGHCHCEASILVLDPIPRTPSAPPYLNVSMNRDNQIHLSWGASSGYVTGYELQYLYSDPNTNAYSGWIYLGETSGTSYTDNRTGWNAGYGFTYRVQAKNGGLASGWTDTGWVFRKGGIYVPYNGARRFGTVYTPGSPPARAKGVWVGNAQGIPEESIRIEMEKNDPMG